MDLVYHVLKAVANNPNTPATALARLSDCHSAQVRHLVSHHPNTSPDVLVKLFYDQVVTVRYGVMRNPATPVEFLVRNASHLAFKEAILANPSAPEPVKMWLRNDGFAGLTLKQFLKKMG